MDPSPLFDPKYLSVILVTLVGFFALAALLLVPVSRFLDREQEVAESWTPEAVAERLRKQQRTATNGTTTPSEEEPPDSSEDSDLSASAS